MARGSVSMRLIRVQSDSSANVYSNGESEVLVGKFMKKYQIPREKLVILTKV